MKLCADFFFSGMYAISVSYKYMVSSARESMKFLLVLLLAGLYLFIEYANNLKHISPLL